MTQNKTIIIGITGGIATGKTTLVNILRDQGYIVIDSDKIAREIVEVNKPAYEEIIEYFGKGILSEDKRLDRKKLGDRIFNNKKEREKLNSITHPYIYNEIKYKIEYYKNKYKIIFVDIPLLVEGWEQLKEKKIIFDKIWLVYLPFDIQIKRLMDRDNIDFFQAKKKINAQLPLEEKLSFASHIINNGKDIIKLKERVIELLSEIS